MELDVEVLRWVLGLIITGVALLFSVWWKIESRQDRKLDDLRSSNEKAHGLLHKKIDESETARNDQHMVLRDKIEEIWKHVVHKGH